MKTYENGNGTLSYQWYEVGENGAEKLTDSTATASTYKAKLKNLGVRSFYCEVTNTVNGKRYSVNTDTVTVTVYQTYVQSLVIAEGENQVCREYGDWPGKESDVTLDSAAKYTLTVVPLNTTAASTYSMTISYNGEAAEAGAFQSELTLDTSKLPEGSSYFTVQVGTYDTAKGAYLASELYRFNVTMTGDYRPVIDAQPQSVASTKSSVKKASLTVSATATGNGTLSYQWYEVGENGAEKLTDSTATASTYKAKLKNLGVRSFYCEVTNTVDGKRYSVNMDP